MHAASRPNHLSQPFPIRWAWSTKFPPAQLGNFMLGVAAGANTLFEITRVVGVLAKFWTFLLFIFRVSLG